MCFARRSTRLLLVALVSASVFPIVALGGQETTAEQAAPAFDKTDLMIPMRDGVKLHTTIFVPKGSTDSVGTIGLAITSKEERSAELGIVIGRADWGKGIGTSAAHLVTGYAFSTLGLAEIQAEVLQRNLASRRLLEKVGFQLLRSIPGDPHSDTDFEDCFLFVLSSQNRTSA